MALPQRLPIDQMQTTWAAQIDPVLSKPFAKAIILKNVTLASGTNTINHRLGRKLEGWIPTRVRSSATLYDSQDSNQTPDLTLVIVASASVTVDLMVF